MALELHHHEFQRSRDTTFCYVCQNVWPANDVVLSKYQNCSVCALGVHTGCRPVAKQCYPCNAAISHTTLSSGEWRSLQTSGIIQAQLLHSYDMLVAPDTPIYAVIKLSSCKDTYQTEKSIVHGNDCLWKPDAMPVQLRYFVQDMDTHVVIGPPLLEVDMYKTIYGIFETNVATCKVSLLPLFLYPDICIERWFTFTSVTDGSMWGKVLMRLKFQPQNKNTSWIEKLSSNAVASTSDGTEAIEDVDVPEPTPGPTRTDTVPTPTSIETPQSVQEETSSSQNPVSFDTTANALADIEALVVFDLENTSIPNNNDGVSDEALLRDHISPISSPEVVVLNNTEKEMGDSCVDGAVNEETPEIVKSDALQFSEDNITPDVSESHPFTTPMAPPSTPPPQHRRRRVPRSKDLPVKPVSRLLPGAVKDTRIHDSHPHPAIPILPSPTPNINQKATEDDKLDAGKVYSAASFGLLSPSTVNWMSDTFSQLVTEAKNYSTMAVDSMTSSSTRRKRKRVNVQDGASEVSSATEDNGIGSLYIHIDSAIMTIARDAADGNYYIIASVDGKADAPEQEEDTDIVHSSASPVFKQNFEFTVFHYRAIVKLTVVDASSDNKVGDASISLHAIIQRDANKYGSDWSKAELEEFVIRDAAERSVGIIRACVKFKEDVNDLIYSLTPRPAPEMPKEEMSFDRIKVHIARAKAIIDNINSLGKEYRRIMDWENPVYTVAALVCFSYTVWTIDAEYALCVPLFAMIALLSVAWIRRKNGSLRKRFVEVKDVEEAVQYRPVGYIRIAVASFRNFVHRFGFSGPPPFVRVSYHCKSEAIPERQIALINLSKSGRHGHRSSNLASIMSSLSMKKSNDAKDALLQNVSDPWPRPGIFSDVDKADVDISYLYPILQPFRSDSKNKTSKQVLVPWNENDGIIKFTFYGDNPMSSFVDSAWGSVNVRVKELFSDASKSMQPEVDGWYDIDWTSAFLNKSRNEHLSSQSSHNGGLVPSMLHKIHDAEPMVFLRMQLDLRNAAKEPTFDDIEISKVVQSLVNPKDDRGETTISAIWNARDHIKFVQNILATIVGTIESFCNIFNWTVPSKTFPIYVLLVATWLASVIIPARYLILSAGWFEFFYKFMPQPEDAPMVIRFENLLKSIPNEDDLEQIYYWERKAHSEKILAEQRIRLKKAKLRILLDCQWDGKVHLRGTSRSSGAATWNPVFLVLQGKRLVWWTKEEDIDEGRAHAGELLLQGHAGITQTSPVDIKEIGDANRLTTIFGRDSIGHQHKITILFNDTHECDAMKTEIQRILD